MASSAPLRLFDHARELAAFRAALPALAEAAKSAARAHAERHGRVAETQELETKAEADVLAADFRTYAVEERSRVALFAGQRHVFEDFVPRCTRALKAPVAFVTAEGRHVGLGEHVAASELAKGAPNITARVFHGDPVRYALAVVDGDHPRPETMPPSITEHIVLLRRGITLCASSTKPGRCLVTAPEGKTILPYTPPRPNKGTGVHRIVTLLFEEQNATQADLPAQNETQVTRSTRVWDLVRTHGWILRGLALASTKWDTSVTEYYKNVVGAPEPHFGPLPPALNTNTKPVTLYSPATRLRNVYRPLAK